MPIPTRTQSVKTRTISGLPSLKSSIRQRAEDGADSNTTRSQPTVQKAVRPITSVRLEREPQTRPASQINPSSSHSRNASTTSISTASARASSTELQTLPASTGRKDTQQRNHGVIEQHRMPNTKNRLNTTVQRQLGNKITLFGTPSVAAARLPKARSMKSPGNDHAATSGAAGFEGPPMLSGRLHDELLQLSMTHLDSVRVLDTYEHSIRQQMAMREGIVAQREVELLQLEQQKQHISSLRALRSQLNQNTASLDSQQIQNLSRTVQVLHDDDLETRHVQILRPFEEWLRRVLGIHETRSSKFRSYQLQFIASLGSNWRHEAFKMEQRLTVIVTALQNGEILSDSSGLAVVLNQNTELAKVLLHELQTAIETEKLVMRAEHEWQQEQLSRAWEGTSSKSAEADVGLWVS